MNVPKLGQLILNGELPFSTDTKCVPVHCESPACMADLSSFRVVHLVESLEAHCPRCGLSGSLVLCDYTHLIVRNQFGPILGSDGHRYNFVCGLARKAFSGNPRNPTFPVHYTTIPHVSDCPDCLLEYGILRPGDYTLPLLPNPSLPEAT